MWLLVSLRTVPYAQPVPCDLDVHAWGANYTCTPQRAGDSAPGRQATTHGGLLQQLLPRRSVPVTSAFAEVDGNRTRRTGITRPTRFEGGEAHQAPGHLRSGA